MFTEYEVATLVEIPNIKASVLEVKEAFIKAEAQLLEISDHDFLSLIMMTPPVGVALSNGSVSLFEEMALNKMARKMSKGGYFLKQDPVAHAMTYLIKNFDQWEETFLKTIRICMDETFDVKDNSVESDHNMDQDPVESFAKDLMGTPYIFVRFLSSFFLHEEAEIVDSRSISKVEFEKIHDIGRKLGIEKIPVFRSFCRTFNVR
ncbi:MAG: hypothetical protein AAFX87_22335 [Bacteroidota bacterium]